MTMLASTEGGWDGAGVGLELSMERLKSWVSRFTMDLGEQFMLEVGVLDTRDASRQHG